MAGSVLDVVLDQLNLTPSEYFQRLGQSLEEGRTARLHRVSSSHETAALIQEEVQPASQSMLGVEDLDELSVAEAGEEDVVAPTDAAAPARPRAKKTTKPRPRATFEEEEDELAEFGIEPLDDDESQFRQAYRRAMRTNRRPFRPER